MTSALVMHVIISESTFSAVDGPLSVCLSEWGQKVFLGWRFVFRLQKVLGAPLQTGAGKQPLNLGLLQRLGWLWYEAWKTAFIYLGQVHKKPTSHYLLLLKNTSQLPGQRSGPSQSHTGPFPRVNPPSQVTKSQLSKLKSDSGMRPWKAWQWSAQQHLFWGTFVHSGNLNGIMRLQQALSIVSSCNERTQNGRRCLWPSKVS